MKSISLNGKLLAFNAIFGVVLVSLLTLFVLTKNQPINFAAKERMGVEYQIPLMRFFHAAAIHKTLLLGGKPANDPLILAEQKKIESALIEIQKVQDKLGEDLQFTKDGLAQRKRENSGIAKLSEDWKKTFQSLTSSQSSKESIVENHNTLIANIRMMVTHLGDTSNLILDPDLDSYYLMDATLIALPQTQDRIQNVATLLETIFSSGVITEAQRNQLFVHAALLTEADHDRIAGDITTAINEDKNFGSTLPEVQNQLPVYFDNFSKKQKAFIEFITKVANSKDLNALQNQWIPLSEAAIHASFDFWDFSISALDNLLVARLKTLTTGRTLAIVFSGLAFLATGLFGFFFSRTLSAQLRGVVDRLNQESEMVGQVAVNIQQGSQKLAEATTEEASAIQQTATAIEEITAMAQQNSKSAEQAEQLAKHAGEVVTEGKRAVDALLKSIDEISGSNNKILTEVEASNLKIKELVRVISNIGEKTKVINDIVFQTKLLSFNASVEAARAGEHGKGFSVVAAEVGQLAQMSGNAAREINQMLSESILQVDSLVKDSESRVHAVISEAKTKVTSGAALARRCGDLLDNVVTGTSQTQDLVSNISHAVAEQVRGISEISKAIHALNGTTQANVVISHEAASSGNKLSAQAVSLNEVVGSLEMVVDGQQEYKRSA